MIKTYANKATEQIAEGKFLKKMPQALAQKALMRLVQLDNAVTLEDLKVPPSNRLEKLIGTRKGQYSIRVNQQWRICFEFKNGTASNVEFTDYH